jgi:hypothetical protein
MEKVNSASKISYIEIQTEVDGDYNRTYRKEISENSNWEIHLCGGEFCEMGFEESQEIESLYQEYLKTNPDPNKETLPEDIKKYIIDVMGHLAGYELRKKLVAESIRFMNKYNIFHI